MLRTRLKSVTALTAGCLTMIAASAATAQDSDTDDNTIEEVVVTGTYLKGKTQSSSPSPIAVIGAGNLSEIGATSVADLVSTLTINAGSQNNPDAFTQGATTGTSNFNLRGLGVAATLVLLNGRRQVSSGTLTNPGVAFVDTSSLIPQIAIQRIEIVKDGAAAIYGTDAVAGVVNFITDDTFEGLALNSQYTTVTNQGSQRDLLIEGKFGWSNDTTNVVLAASFLDRTSLTTGERRLSRVEDDDSSLGNPGAFFGVPNVATPASVPLIDPTGCTEFGGLGAEGAPVVGVTPGGLPIQAGICGFDFGDFFDLVPDEERTQLFGVVTHEFGEGHTLRVEGGFSKNDTIRNNSPSFPFLQLASAVVPASNPGNVFEAPVTFFGRVSGNGGVSSPGSFDSKTYRFVTEIDGPINDNWDYDLGFVYARNDFVQDIEDTVTDRFGNALRGFGGEGCAVPDGDDFLNGVGAGVGACLYFNPFSTSFGPIPNDPDLVDYVIGNQVTSTTSRLITIDAVASGTIGSTSAGDIGLAVGFQYRNENFDRSFDDISQADGFAFLIGGQDFQDSRGIFALFAETFVPVADEVDLQVAVRYESYGGSIGSTIDPKVSVLIRPSDTVTLRASYSTSFRAPSQFQILGQGTSLNQVSDPLTGGTFFAAVRNTDPGPNGRSLVAEQSEAINLGMTWHADNGFSLDLDYFRYNFSDAITPENFQAVVNSDPEGDQVQRAFPGGPILFVFVDFVNATSIKTDGFDFNLRWDIETDSGTIQPFIEGTRLFNYDLIDPNLGAVSGAGARNFGNFGSPTPKLRFNTGISFSNDNHAARLFVRYISGLDDDQNANNPGFERIGSFTTLDAQYKMNLGVLFDTNSETSLSFGFKNLLNNTPPLVATNGGFEARTHNPVGRQFYVGLSSSF
ncbi:MAG: TonB-dependent receptor [Kordiimonadales bacterium]|nr:MAG: TonB-dependent receptor [Kordiimonadales bacterium]